MNHFPKSSNVTAVCRSLCLKLGVNELCFEGSRLLSLYLIILYACVCQIVRFKRKLGTRDRKQRKRKGSWHLFSHILKPWQRSENKILLPQNAEKNQVICIKVPLWQCKHISETNLSVVFMCVPYNRGWLNLMETPLGQLLSLQLGPVQKHPGL